LQNEHYDALLESHKKDLNKDNIGDVITLVHQRAIVLEMIDALDDLWSALLLVEELLSKKEDLTVEQRAELLYLQYKLDSALLLEKCKRSLEEFESTLLPTRDEESFSKSHHLTKYYILLLTQLNTS